MATMVSMFYSQRSRRTLVDASKKWTTQVEDEPKKELFNLFKSVLNDRYLMKTMPSKDNEGSGDKDTFIKILKTLHLYKPETFPYNIDIHSGFRSEYYIGKLYELLDVDCKIFHYNYKTGFIFYSFLNKELDSVEYKTEGKKIKIIYNDNNFDYYDVVMNAPKILIVAVNEYNDFRIKELYKYTTISDKDNDTTKKEITSMDEIIEYRGSKYHLDSVILQNWNDSDETGHAIVGITCNENKYVYNGWKKRGGNDACDLMPHNWEIKGDAEKGDVCINNTNCTMDTNLQYDKRFCFNFKKGKRVLIYVRNDDNPSNTSKKQSQKP
jgi:hypothetical protein